MTSGALCVALTALGGSLGGCPKPSATGPSETRSEGPPAPASAPRDEAALAPLDPLARLYDVEQDLRRAIADGPPPPGPGGADPTGVAALDDGSALVTLSATHELLLLLPSGRERARVPSARGAADVAVFGIHAFVVGPRDGRLLRHPVAPGPHGQVAPAVTLFDGLQSPSAVTVAELGEQGCVIVADDVAGELRTVAADASPPATASRTPIGPRLIGVDAFDDLVVARSLVDHTAVVLRASVSSATGGCGLSEVGRVEHDGPLYAAAAWTNRRGRTQLIVAGVEDRPLDRSDGFFGDLDTAVFAYRHDGERFVRQWATNVGELGLVNVKALVLEGASRRPRAVLAFSGGSAVAARLATADGQPERPLSAWPITDVVRGRSDTLLLTSQLLDVVLVQRASGVGLQPARVLGDLGGPERDPLVALGEALAFTSLMSERPAADGQHSVVSCESCHHQLSVDGRTHFTGRTRDGERVVATTRTLFGLIQARPHFSRALDKTSTIMVDNEFGVMAAGTAGEARFTLRVDDHHWLPLLGLKPGSTVDAVTQREALMRFLASAPPPPAPATRDRRGADDAAFTPLEAAGADTFAARCSRCHAPRVLLDDEHTVVERERWAEHLFGDKPSIVWARDGYEKTGVTPYVHDDGARPSPLFGLWLKRPLLTTGEVSTLEQLLANVRDGESGFLHRPAEGDEGAGALDDAERQALLAFLQLL